MSRQKQQRKKLRRNSPASTLQGTAQITADENRKSICFVIIATKFNYCTVCIVDLIHEMLIINYSHLRFVCMLSPFSLNYRVQVTFLFLDYLNFALSQFSLNNVCQSV